MGAVKRQKAVQAAMEFMMTYGWAILILIIAIGVLFQLGIFDLSSYQPRATPGSCIVYRPYGPGTTQLVALSGVCVNELPQFVMNARASNELVWSPNSNTPTSPTNIQGTPNITITVWVNVYGSPFHDVVDKEQQYGLKLDYNGAPHACTGSINTGFCIEWDTSNNWVGLGEQIPGAGFNQWLFLAVTQRAGLKSWYANGNFIGSQAVSGNLMWANSLFTLGGISPCYGGVTCYVGYGSAEWFNGIIANVQLYNSTLSANQISVLYHEGIGGAPDFLPSLVGWWPLNGNANDYSGNNVSTVANSIRYFPCCPGYKTT